MDKYHHHHLSDNVYPSFCCWVFENSFEIQFRQKKDSHHITIDNNNNNNRIEKTTSNIHSELNFDIHTHAQRKEEEKPQNKKPNG